MRREDEIPGTEHAGEDRLRSTERPRGSARLHRLDLVDDRPVVRTHRGNLCRGVLRDLDEVADVTEMPSGSVDRLRVCHVDRDEALHPGALQSPDCHGVPAELLRHREHRQTQPPRLLAQRHGVLV